MKMAHLSQTALLLSLPAATLADGPPNIILFVVDDMGWQDTSVPFWTERTLRNDTYETPNMELLAARGMMFTQAYASSISSPSRCSLLTGANAARHRVTNWTLEKDKTTDGDDGRTAVPDWNYNGVCQVPGTRNAFVATALPQILKDAGYHTIHCGKAHWGAIDTPGEDPHHFGFEVNIAGHAAGGLASYLGEENYGHDAEGRPVSAFAVPGLEKYWGTETFATEALTREALRALDKAKRYAQPFFLHMSHYAVHVPFDRDARFFDKYRRKGLPDNEAAYAALIEGMDKSLGDIMGWLDDNGLAGNTVVIFVSDNGGLAIETGWRSGPPHTQNAPLRSGKGSLYEGGIRVPMVVAWPGVAQEASRCAAPVIIEDLFPTVAEMAQAAGRPTAQEVDGRSLVPLLRQEEADTGRLLVWNFPNNWGVAGPGINFCCAARRGDWKLVYHYDTGVRELYNLADDIGETTDLAARHPDVVRRLSADLGGYLRGVGAQRPLDRAMGVACPWPDSFSIDN